MDKSIGEIVDRYDQDFRSKFTIDLFNRVAGFINANFRT
jgi:hypothetical protein